jgi:hypothetical protein
MKDTCRAIEDGIEDWPGYIDWEDWGLPHTPFGDPEKNCDQLKEVEDKIRQCLSDLAPNCSDWQPNPGGYICGTIYQQMRDGEGDAPDQKVDRSNSAFYSELDATIEYLKHETPSNVGFSAVVYPSSCSFTMPSVMSK